MAALLQAGVIDADATFSNNHGPFTVGFAHAVPAGAFLVVVIADGLTNGNADIRGGGTVTDSQGNTYTMDGCMWDDVHCFVVTSPITHALTAADTLTFTLGNGYLLGDFLVYASSFSGVTALHLAGAATSDNHGGPENSTVAATAGDLLIGIVVSDHDTTTDTTSPWAAIVTDDNAGGFSHIGVSYATATGSETYTASSSGGRCGVLAVAYTASAATTGEFDLTQGQSVTVTGTPAAVQTQTQAQALTLTTQQPQFEAVLAQGQAVHALSPAQLVDVAAIASGEAFGAATVALTTPQALDPVGIASAEAFDVPEVLNLGQVIVVTGVPSSEAFGAPELTTPASQFIGPYPIVSEPVFGIAELSQAASHFAPLAIDSGEAFGTPIVLGTAPVPLPPRNYLIDRKTGEVYPWPVNHETEDSVKTLGRRLTRSGISASGRLIATRKVFLIRHPSHPGPVHLLLHGSLIDRDQLQYRTFVRFFNSCDDRTFDYIDASGDSYHVVLVQFDARRKLSPARTDGSYFSYSLEVEVLDVNHGAYKRYAV